MSHSQAPSAIPEQGPRQPGLDQPDEFEAAFHRGPKGDGARTSSGDSGYASGQYPSFHQPYHVQYNTVCPQPGHQNMACEATGDQSHSSPHSQFQNQAPNYNSYYPNTYGGAYTAQNPSPASHLPRVGGYPPTAYNGVFYNGQNWIEDQKCWQRKAKYQKCKERCKALEAEMESLRRGHKQEVEALEAEKGDLRRQHKEEAEALQHEKQTVKELTHKNQKLDRTLKRVSQTLQVVREELAGDLTASGRWDRGAEVLQDHIDALEEQRKSYTPDAMDVESVETLDYAIVDAKVKLGEALFHSKEYEQAEAWFREAFDYWKDELKDWQIERNRTRNALSWLCKALGEQDDHSKLEEALDHHLSSRPKLYSPSSTKEDLAWAVKNLVRCPPIYVKQGQYAKAAAEVCSAWHESFRLADKYLTTLAKETVAVAASIPQEHVTVRTGILDCVCDNQHIEQVDKVVQRQAQWALAQDLCREKRWKGAKTWLNRLARTSNPDGGPSEAELGARLVFVHRELREWGDAGAVAIDLFEKHGCVDHVTTGPEGVDYLGILSEVIRRFAKSNGQKDVKVQREQQQAAAKLLSRCLARTKSLKPGKLRRQAGSLVKVAVAGDELAAEWKQRPTSSSQTYRDLKRKADEIKRNADELWKLVSDASSSEGDASSSASGAHAISQKVSVRGGRGLGSTATLTL